MIWLRRRDRAREGSRRRRVDLVRVDVKRRELRVEPKLARECAHTVGPNVVLAQRERLKDRVVLKRVSE